MPLAIYKPLLGIFSNEFAGAHHSQEKVTGRFEESGEGIFRIWGDLDDCFAPIEAQISPLPWHWTRRVLQKNQHKTSKNEKGA